MEGLYREVYRDHGDRRHYSGTMLLYEDCIGLRRLCRDYARISGLIKGCI